MLKQVTLGHGCRQETELPSQLCQCTSKRQEKGKITKKKKKGKTPRNEWHETKAGARCLTGFRGGKMGLTARFYIVSIPAILASSALCFFLLFTSKFELKHYTLTNIVNEKSRKLVLTQLNEE